jgi:hypothetical protein
VTVFHHLPGVSEGEEIDYYTPGDRERLQRDLLRKTEHYFALFSNSEYEDHFSCAEYEPPDDYLTDAELDTFRSALDLDDRDCPPSDLHPRAIFHGYCAVVDLWIRSKDLAICQKGIELFNSVMESALPTDDSSNPRCYVTLQTAKEFAPAFIGDLLDAVRTCEKTRFSLPRWRYVGEAMKPLQPLLTMLAKMVTNEAWPKSDLALGKFLLLADYYRELMRGWPCRQISGGKIIKQERQKVKNRVAEALRMAASTLARSDSYLGARSRHLRNRLGPGKAIKAMAAHLARLIYRMLTHGQAWVDRGALEHETKRAEREKLSLQRKAAAFGFRLEPAA